jgi:hypothetical protein
MDSIITQVSREDEQLNAFASEKGKNEFSVFKFTSQISDVGELRCCSVLHWFLRASSLEKIYKFFSSSNLVPLSSLYFSVSFSYASRYLKIKNPHETLCLETFNISFFHC